MNEIISLVKRKRWSVHMSVELRHYSNLSRHIKEPQNSIYCLNFLQNDKNWKLRLCFIPKVTCSVLSVGVLSVYSLLRDVFFTAREHDVWLRAAWLVRHSNSNEWGAGLCEGSTVGNIANQRQSSSLIHVKLMNYFVLQVNTIYIQNLKIWAHMMCLCPSVDESPWLPRLEKVVQIRNNRSFLDNQTK